MYEFQDDDVICSCKQVSKKRFLAMLQQQQLTTLDLVREKTGINKACGMCIVIVEKLLLEHAS